MKGIILIIKLTGYEMFNTLLLWLHLVVLSKWERLLGNGFVMLSCFRIGVLAALSM